MSAAYHGRVEKSLQDGRAGYRPGRIPPSCGNASALRAFPFGGVRKARAASEIGVDRTGHDPAGDERNGLR